MPMAACQAAEWAEWAEWICKLQNSSWKRVLARLQLVWRERGSLKRDQHRLDLGIRFHAVARILSSAGLSTTVHPAASAGAIFATSIASGKLQGVMEPTTPMGSRSVYA
jgi:hypothetical protein